MRKVYFAVFGSGLGHATRACDIARSLRERGDRVRFSSSGQGLRFIESQGAGEDAVSCPELDVEWTAEGSFSSRDFVVHFPFMLRSFANQVAFEAASIRRFDPRVAVSDSKLSAVLAARSASYPVVTMLNQFMVTLPPRYRGGAVGRLYERIAGDVLGLLWSLSDQVLMTDLPPPYTIGEANIGGTDLSRIARYVGFTSPRLDIDQERLESARASLGLDRRPLVFMQISGPDATKSRFAEIAVRAAADLSRRYNVVISMGYLSGDGEPRRLADGTILYDWCPIKDELFALSEVVVARSGHRTIGQCVDLRKPAVLVPIHNHSEQMGNGEKFARLGLGVCIQPGDFTPARLAAAVDACADDPRFRSNLDTVGAVSSRYRGIETCAEVIDSYG